MVSFQRHGCRYYEHYKWLEAWSTNLHTLAVLDSLRHGGLRHHGVVAECTWAPGAGRSGDVGVLAGRLAQRSGATRPRDYESERRPAPGLSDDAIDIKLYADNHTMFARAMPTTWPQRPRRARRAPMLPPHVEQGRRWRTYSPFAQPGASATTSTSSSE